MHIALSRTRDTAYCTGVELYLHREIRLCSWNKISRKICYDLDEKTLGEPLSALCSMKVLTCGGEQ